MTPEQQLLAKCASGELTPAEASSLAEACQNDPQLLEAVARLTLTERLLTPASRDPNGDFFALEVEARLRSQRDTLLLPKRSWPAIHRFTALACVAAALLIVFGLAYQFRTPSATLIRLEASANSTSLHPGSKLDAHSRFKLDSGVAQLRFASGAEVIIQAPAELEIIDPTRFTLIHGRAVAEVPKQATGFSIETARARFVDLGTIFAVSVEETGTEAHVLKGAIEAWPKGEPQPIRLVTNQAVALSDSGLRHRPATPATFITAMPSESARPVNFVHWSLDESGTTSSADIGRNLGGGQASLKLTRVQPTNRPPTWIQGRFGSALSFDGRGAYAQSDFPGIGGGAPRTVAFWVRVPRDFKSNEGFGIMAWGNGKQPGQAWQISINPRAADGPVGRLRMGVYQGPVVGTTDLRDNQWHHCAVVLHPGDQPTTQNHVVLYVDGLLDPTSQVGPMTIKTAPPSPESRLRGVWIGRAIDEVESFRGAIDEIFIFDSALNQAQILSLMKRNSLQ